MIQDIKTTSETKKIGNLDYMLNHTIHVILLVAIAGFTHAETNLTDWVNPFLGTAPLTKSEDIGYTPPRNWRVWAGLTFPGAALPNAMVQLSPITEFGSGAGYEYEDDTIYAFTHTNKGHWNLCYIPMLPVCGDVSVRDFGSGFSHQNESARPGYYQVLLERYNINAELTSTLRCGYHKYTYKDNNDKKLLVNLAVSNERIRRWDIEQDGANAFKGYQRANEQVFFYAVTNHNIQKIEFLENGRQDVPLLHFEASNDPLEIKIALSFVSTENAKANLRELEGKSFEQVKNEASQTWQALLSKINVSGGTDRQKQLFYSSLYRSFLWPALRSDINGEFTDANRDVVKKDFRYYTTPSLWDTYRNKLVLLGMLSPEVTVDVIKSLIDKGEKRGFMPTFFHGDHAAVFIAGTYLRGLQDFDIKGAYDLLVRNATVEGGTRPHIAEYIDKGYISTPEIEHPNVETKAKAGVTKTLEYAYDDYAVALLAKELNDKENYDMLMKRTGNYKNLFDSSTGLMRGRLENGEWVKPFNPQYPYYEYMYREANAWQSTFFAPHDVKGLVGLYQSKEAFEHQLDAVFTIPWNPAYIARNVSCFIGQYCHGNQPDHSYPYLYYFVDKQEKCQKRIDQIMDRFYGMGDTGLALCGMDDAGEMSSWYVFNAIGLYPFSPADPEYIITVPVFDTVDVRLSDNSAFTIIRKNSGSKITEITYDSKNFEGYFISHQELEKGKQLVITTQ